MGLFSNPLKNPKVLNMVFGKAQEELNEALIYRKKQFEDPNLYMWVEIERGLPFVCLRNQAGENLVRMTAQQLLEDKAIQLQLKKIPAIVRPFIKWDIVLPKMNAILVSKLGEDQNIKVTEGPKKAIVDLWELGKEREKNVSLAQIFL